MRNLAALSVAAFAFLVTATSGFGQASTNRDQQVAKKPVPTCSLSTKINFSVATGAVSAKGTCKLKGKPLVGKYAYTYSYTVQDAAGNTCGSKPVVGTKRGFVANPAGAYKVRVHFTLSFRGSKKAGMWYTVPLGGDNLQCGVLQQADLPSPATLCPVSTFPDGNSVGDRCGVSNSYASFTSPMSLTDNVISFGHVATRGGNCSYTSQHVGSFPGLTSVKWLGQTLRLQYLKCPDGVLAWANAWSLFIVTPSGHSCSTKPFGGVWHLPIPSDWGGKLYVVSSIGVAFDWRSDARPVALERESAEFDLPVTGTVDPCQALGLQES